MQKAIGNKMQVKMGFRRLLEGFLMDFCSNLPSKRGSKMFGFFVHFRSWSPLGAILGPRSPKSSPRGLLGPIQEDFDPHFGGFWEDLGAHLGGFWGGLVPTTPPTNQSTNQAAKQATNQPTRHPHIPTSRGAWPLAEGT